MTVEFFKISAGNAADFVYQFEKERVLNKQKYILFTLKSQRLRI